MSQLKEYFSVHQLDVKFNEATWKEYSLEELKE